MLMQLEIQTEVVEEVAKVEEVNEEEIVDEVDEVDEVEEDDEISFVKKKIKGQYYFISDEEPPQVYEYINDTDIGKLIGKMIDKKIELY